MKIETNTLTMQKSSNMQSEKQPFKKWKSNKRPLYVSMYQRNL